MDRISKEKMIGIVGTVLVHVVLGVLLYFLVLKTPPTPTEKKHKFPWFIYSGEWKRKNNNYGII